MTTYRDTQVIRIDDRRVVCTRTRIATTWWRRMRGLLGHARLSGDEGIWLSPCGGIHTVGMRYAIDAVFLDREGEVRRIAAHVRPYTFRPGPRGTRTTIELPAGAAAKAGLDVGDRLCLRAASAEDARDQ